MVGLFLASVSSNLFAAVFLSFKSVSSNNFVTLRCGSEAICGSSGLGFNGYPSGMLGNGIMLAQEGMNSLVTPWVCLTA